MSGAEKPVGGFELAGTAPATEPQQEIWMAIQLGGEEASLAYNESASLGISGSVDPELLGEAWRALASRHEALRTCFTADGQTLCIEKLERIPWRTEDWSADAPVIRARKRAALIGSEVGTAFDLINDPAYRAVWVDYGGGESEFFMTGHHILCDGYSSGVLLSELCAVYTALSSGGDPGLDPAPTFSSYAVDQKKALNSPEAGDAERYWLSALGESPETLDLPADSTRPLERTFAARRLDYAIGPELLDEMKKTARGIGVSLSSMFLAAVEAFLRRLSGQNDFVVGMPSAGQSLPGFAALVGHCVNTLPLPARLDPDMSFAALAKSCTSAILDGIDNQVLSFGGLLRKLRLPRDPARIPLIPVLVNLDPPMKLGSLGAASVEAHSHPRRFEAFEIFLNGAERDGRLILETTYGTALFGEDTIRRWLGDFEALLRRIVVDAGAKLSDLTDLSAESLGLIEEWNRTERPVPARATALSLFEERAASSPGALAARDFWTGATYKELDSRANRIAHLLVEAGVAPGGLVGVCLGRHIDMLASLLAIWKAGAAYLPLDPDFPEERLSFIVGDSGIKALVTETKLKDAISAGGLSRIYVDQDKGTAESGPAVARLEDPPAYVLYTSGSTGKPKGVLVGHDSLANFLLGMVSELGISSSDVVVSVTTLSFDIAGLELFMPIVSGAQTVIATREEALDGKKLSHLLDASSATLLQATPATWQLLLEARWKGSPSFKALCGGEALPVDLARRLLPLVGSLWNMYGPTETTIWSTMERIESADSPISIGRPIANTTAHIVDESLRSVPIGASGELLLGGRGVARGYFKRPDLTSARFVPDPFSKEAGARAYRTGDICRFGPDGRIYYQHRNDSQVKIRGFRIELGEIEAALSESGSVSSAVAAVKDFGGGDARLVGYFVPRDGREVEIAGLKAEVASRLPPYMIPQHFVRLDKLPLTPNGKIDRKALPLPDGGSAPARERVAPSTPVQERLAEIWSELLRIDSLGVTDNFFDLGGHSILAARMLSRLRESFGVEIPMRSVFQSQTIEKLALVVDTALLAASGEAAGGERAEILEF